MRNKKQCKTGKFPYSSRIKAISRFGLEAKIVSCEYCHGWHVKGSSNGK
jgi:hypothetical protein